MNGPLYESQESLGFMTITTNRLMSAFFRRKLRDAGIDLTAEQWGILIMLWNRKNGATQEELASIACVDKSSMSRVLALMEDKELIIRRTDPADARRKHIHASGKAQALQAAGLTVARKVFDLALADVSREECAICLKVLASIKNALRETDL
jgi:MarR family transcriptional regulator for hemolysin